MKKNDIDVKHTTPKKLLTAESFFRILSSAGVVIAAYRGFKYGADVYAAAQICDFLL